MIYIEVKSLYYMENTKTHTGQKLFTQIKDVALFSFWKLKICNYV